MEVKEGPYSFGGMNRSPTLAIVCCYECRNKIVNFSAWFYAIILRFFYDLQVWSTQLLSKNNL